MHLTQITAAWLLHTIVTTLLLYYCVATSPPCTRCEHSPRGALESARKAATAQRWVTSVCVYVCVCMYTCGNVCVYIPCTHMPRKQWLCNTCVHIYCIIIAMNEPRHTYEWFTSHLWMSFVTLTHESCHTWMSHVTHVNESRYTYKWVVSHICMSHVTRMNASYVTHVMHTNANYVTCHAHIISCMSHK